MYSVVYTKVLLVLLATQAVASSCSDCDSVVPGAGLEQRDGGAKHNIPTSTTAPTTDIATAPTTAPTVIVSPLSCPASLPSGSVISQSSAQFSKKNAGLQYFQYANSQYTFSDRANGPFFVDLSNPDALAISMHGNQTLILHMNGTFEAFINACAVQVIGSWGSGASSSKIRLRKRQTAALDSCDGIHHMCTDNIAALTENTSLDQTCEQVGGVVGAEAGAFVGSVGSLPGALTGAVAGRLLGPILCKKGAEILGDKECDYDVCSPPIYRDAKKQCQISKGPGEAIFCCTGGCLNTCSAMYNLCLDYAGGPPSCPSAQVFYPGQSTAVDSGDGKCWINASDCRWQKNMWTWRCCACPANYQPVQDANVCQVGLPSLGAAGPPSPGPCIGCDHGKTLQGGGSSGFYCNW